MGENKIFSSHFSTPFNKIIEQQYRLHFHIFSYDTRGQSHAEARHWSEEKILGGRAFFRGDLKPARLIIDKVNGTDAGEYRCRADFYRAPTTISHMKLDVIGKIQRNYIHFLLKKHIRKILLVFVELTHSVYKLVYIDIL